MILLFWQQVNNCYRVNFLLSVAEIKKYLSSDLKDINQVFFSLVLKKYCETNIFRLHIKESTNQCNLNFETSVIIEIATYYHSG